MLEATLKLIYSFSECGPQHNKLVNDGLFPAMLNALFKVIYYLLLFDNCNI